MALVAELVWVEPDEMQRREPASSRDEQVLIDDADLAAAYPTLDPLVSPARSRR